MGVLTATSPTPDLDRTLGADDAPSAAYAYDDLARGDSVGRYLVLRPLGRGGMGAVYAAHDPELDRTVALKIVHRSGSRGVSLKDEAQTLARLSHPNVVAVHDVGELPDGVFIAMDYVEGITLGAWTREHEGEHAALASVMREAGRGLAAAHRAGLVHLDFKPDNVMIATDGRVLVLDFGLAQTQERTADGTNVAPVGTPAYMAPEQHRRDAFDARTDQFSFCVSWFECALGRRPFPGRTPSAVARAVVEGNVDLPTRPPSMPRNVWLALLRGIETDPEKRWPSMEALLAATSPPSRSRRQTVAAAAVAGVLGAAATWAFASSDTRCVDAGRKVAQAWSDEDATTLRARADADFPAERAEQIAQRLGDYAAVLTEGYEEACRVAPDNLPRRVCLDGRLEQLRASRSVAMEGTAMETARLFEVLQDVPSCRRADEEALFREVSDPKRAKAVFARMAQGSAWSRAGRVADAGQAFADVVPEAHALGWRGVEAVARVELGTLAAFAGDTEESKTQLERALMLAAEAGSDDATYSALLQRLQEYALAGDAVSVAALAPAVRASARRSGKPEGAIDLAQGNALQLTGRYADAEAAYDRALESTLDRSQRLRTISNVGAIALYLGRYAEAKGLFEQALPGFHEEHGRFAIATLKAEVNLADADQQLGHLEAAIARYRSVLQRYASVDNDEGRAAQHAKLNLATGLLNAGQTTEARQVGVPAAQRMIEMHGEAHVFSLAARDFLNELVLQDGEPDRARGGTEALIEDMTELLGSEAALLGTLELQLAGILLVQERAAEGLPHADDAKRLIASLDADHPLLVRAELTRADLLRASGDLPAALEAADEAVRRSGGASVHPVHAGLAHLARAEALLASDGADARPDLEQAKAYFAETPQHIDARIDRVEALLSSPR